MTLEETLSAIISQNQSMPESTFQPEISGLMGQSEVKGTGDTKAKADKDKILNTALETVGAAAAGLLGRRGHTPSLPGGASVGGGAVAQAQGTGAAQPGIDPLILQRIIGGL